MALTKSLLSLDCSESDSEELPTFAFLKKEPSSAKRRPTLQANEVIVVDTDSEASGPPSPGSGELPPVPCAAVTPTQTEPLRVPSSRSEDEEELVPLAQRLQCKFLTHKQLSPKDSSPSGKSVEEPQNERTSRTWEKPSPPKVSNVPLGDSSVLSAADNQARSLDIPCHKPPAARSARLTPSNGPAETKMKSGITPPQKRAKGLHLQGRASRRESTSGQQRKQKAALVSRMKAQRPEECWKHMVVVLDPGPARPRLRPSRASPARPPADQPFPCVAELLQTEGGGQLLGALQSLGCRCVVEQQAVPRSVTWRRRAAPAEVGVFW